MKALIQFFSSVKLAIVLIIIITAASILGTFIPQNRGIEEYTVRFGQLADLLVGGSRQASHQFGTPDGPGVGNGRPGVFEVLVGKPGRDAGAGFDGHGKVLLDEPGYHVGRDRNAPFTRVVWLGTPICI